MIWQIGCSIYHKIYHRVLLWFVSFCLIIHIPGDFVWYIFPYPSGLLHLHWGYCMHYNSVIMSAMASQITSLTIVYSGADQKKTSKLCVTGLCEGNSPVTGEFPIQGASNAEMFPFDDAIIYCSGSGEGTLGDVYIALGNGYVMNLLNIYSLFMNIIKRYIHITVTSQWPLWGLKSSALDCLCNWTACLS